MRAEEEAHSISASFSDFCSVGDRVQGNKEQTLIRENSRLRRQHSEICEKYIKMCNDMARMQMREIQKQRKITQLDLFYRREIEELKKELVHKNSQLAKIVKVKGRVEANAYNNQNNNQNCERIDPSAENRSVILSQVMNQNVRLHQMIGVAVDLFEPYAKSKENSELYKRIVSLRKELEKKPNMSSVLEKSNNILEEVRSKSWENQGETGLVLMGLKSKINRVKKAPLSFDFDLEAESKELQVLFTDLDIQMRLTKPRCQQ